MTYKSKILYVGLVCFSIHCLSSIALETGSRRSFRSTSPTRSAVFNNLFRRNYNLRIKVMVTDVLAAFVSTIMLAIGDIYGIPYLYLPWLLHTFEGIAFHEGPTLFRLAYAILPDASMLTEFFMFTTFLLYIAELCFWKDIFLDFERCWRNYNRRKKLEAARSTAITSEELYGENKGKLHVASIKSKDKREAVGSWNEFASHDTTTELIDLWYEFDDSIAKSAKEDSSFKNRRSRSSFTEVTG